MNTRLSSAIICFAFMALSAPAIAAPDDAAPAPDKPTEVQIHFPNAGGVYDWRADGEEALYIQGRDRQWYHAKLMSPCIGLTFAEHIGFISQPTDTFDKFSQILVERRTCQVTSLVKSDKPSSGKS